jgi:hypothetical protein
LNRKILSFELDLDFILIAITSNLRDYRLCYYINKELNTDFRKISDYCLNLFHGTESLQFSQYCYRIEASETEFYVIANQGAAGYLIPEMAEVNYFILIKNHFDDEDLDNMLHCLKRIREIDAVKQIDPKNIKSNENLLF